MLSRQCFAGLFGVILLAALSTTAAWADSLVSVTSKAGQSANDSVQWSQLGGDGTIVGSSSSLTSATGNAVTVTLTGPNSIVSVACAASPCSWAGAGFAAGESLIWTSDSSNGGNGPLTLSFAGGVSGAGASIQADGPGQFTAQIQAFNGATSLGSFTVSSDTNGDAVYIGVLDQSGANITSVVFSLTTCAETCSDFTIDTLNLNSSPGTAVSLVTSLSPSAFGQAVTFTATVRPALGSGTPTGTVTFKDGAIALGAGTLSGGTVALTTSGLGGGTHSITAVYAGDANFAGSTSPALTQTVNKGTSSVSVTSSNNPSSRGAPVTFTATVSTSAAPQATGMVTFQDGSSALGATSLSGGVASFTTSGLGPGAHSITALYAGDANYTGNTSPVLPETVGKAASSTSVVSSNNPSLLGASVTFTASVTSVAGTPTGSVTFQDGASTLGTGTLSGGAATFTTSSLAIGAHSITAIYGGDTTFAGSTSPALTQTVNKTPSSTSLASTNNPSISGSSVTFNATVTSAVGAPTGTVIFEDSSSALGTVALSGGKAAFTTSTLAAGMHSITAVYGGDANFGVSTSAVLTQTVSDFSLSASPTATTISAGTTSTYAITVIPVGGFSQTISFQCSGAPSSVTCAPPASVSATGGSYAPFNVTVTMSASSLAAPAALVRNFGNAHQIAFGWLLAMIAFGILGVSPSAARGRWWRISTVAIFLLLVCAGCAPGASNSSTNNSSGNSSPNPTTPSGTYTLTLTGASGSLSHKATLTLTVR